MIVSTPASAAAIFMGRFRSPMTALVLFAGNAVGVRSRTRT
jgi:hypothetical protein